MRGVSHPPCGRQIIFAGKRAPTGVRRCSIHPKSAHHLRSYTPGDLGVLHVRWHTQINCRSALARDAVCQSPAISQTDHFAGKRAPTRVRRCSIHPKSAHHLRSYTPGDLGVVHVRWHTQINCRSALARDAVCQSPAMWQADHLRGQARSYRGTTLFNSLETCPPSPAGARPAAPARCSTLLFLHWRQRSVRRRLARSSHCD